MDIDTSRLRINLPQIGEQPYRQVHAHSTGNPNSLRHKMKQITICVVQLSQDFSPMW